MYCNYKEQGYSRRRSSSNIQYRLSTLFRKQKVYIMTVQDLYDVISDISTQDVKLYFVTRKTKENITKKMRAKDKYLFRVYQIDCDDELRETILSASKEQLKATIDKNFDLVDYDILSDETENLFTYSIKNKVFSFSDVVTNQLLSTNIEKVKNLFDITSNGDSLWAY